MKTVSALLVALVGVACIVFGIIFMMQASDAKKTLSDELAPNLQISQVDAAYAQASAAYKANTDPAKAVSITLQYNSLGLAKSNAGLIKFVQNLGILEIVIGAGFVIVGLMAFKKSS